MPTPYTDAYADYLAALAKQGKATNHDTRCHHFVRFLADGFGADVSEMEIEEKLRVAEVRGFIDALYNSVIFEFKKDLKEAPERCVGRALGHALNAPKYLWAQLNHKVVPF